VVTKAALEASRITRLGIKEGATLAVDGPRLQDAGYENGF